MYSAQEDLTPGTYWHVIKGETWSQYALIVEGEQKAGFLRHSLGSLVMEGQVGKPVELLVQRELGFEEAVAAAEKYAGIWLEQDNIPYPRKEA